jgi:hypothetical protein
MITRSKKEKRMSEPALREPATDQLPLPHGDVSARLLAAAYITV